MQKRMLREYSKLKLSVYLFRKMIAFSWGRTPTSDISLTISVSDQITGFKTLIYLYLLKYPSMPVID